MADVISYVIRVTDQAKAGLASATRGAQAYEKATEEATKATDGLGKSTKRLRDSKGRYIKSAGQAEGAARSFAGGLNASGVSAQRLVGLLGVAGLAGSVTLLGRKMVGLTQEVADYRNDLGDAATRSGFLAETIEGLQFAAEGAGLSLPDLTSGLDMFGARLAVASKGSNDTARAFESLGVQVTTADGQLRDADAVLRETLAALNGMERGAERSALAVQTLGRSGGRLLQALSGSQLEDFVALTKEFGVDTGPEATRAAGEWQRAVAELELVLRGLKSAFVDAFGLGADTVFEFTSALVVSAANLRTYADNADTLMNEVVLSVAGMFEFLDAQLGRVTARVEGIGLVLGTVATSVADLLQEMATKFLAGDFLGAGQAASNIGQAIADGMAEGLELTEARVAAADKEFFDAAAQGSAQIQRARDAFEDAGREADASAGRALAVLERSRASILAGIEQQRGGLTFGDGDGSSSGKKGKLIRPGQRLDDTAGEIDRALAAALGSQGALDEAGQVIADNLGDIAREARALITQQRVGNAVGLGQSVLSGNLGGTLGSVGDMVGGAAGARLGAAGAVVGGLQFIGEQGAEGIEQTLKGVKDGLITALRALPRLIGDILPEFAVSLVAELIPALIEASPDIFRALIVELPKAIGDAVASAIGVESETGRGALRGASLGAAIGGVTAGVFTLGIGTGAGAAIGGSIGAGVGATLGRERDRSEANSARTAARTANSGRASYTRTEDRLNLIPSRAASRGSQPATLDSPFGMLDREFERQFGRYGRDSSTILREA